MSPPESMDEPPDISVSDPSYVDLASNQLLPLSEIVARVTMLGVALRESENRLRLLLDAVTEFALFTLDPNGIIESWNTGAEQMKGYTTEEALGRHFSMLYTAEDRNDGLPGRLLERARVEGFHAQTGWRVRKDGSQFWGDVVISALHDESGNHTGFVKVVRDRSEQHRLEAAQDSLYDAFKHDIRLPVAAVKGYAYLIGDADPEHDEFVERIESNANLLLAMVEELVAHAKLRSGLLPMNLQVVDMTALAQIAVADLGSIVDTSRVRVTASASLSVLADPSALERVVANLVTNALKYSPAESDVDLFCEEENQHGVMRFVDQGRGIDERDLDAVFLDFERGRLAENDDSGTGLGLASVQRLIGMQGGTVAITSEIAAGTTVTVRLPLAPKPPRS